MIQEKQLIELANKVKAARDKEFKPMCFNCGKEAYGPFLNSGFLTCITVSGGICPECGKKTGIVPASDWQYACNGSPTGEDWD